MAQRPNRYIITTDFATFKLDSRGNVVSATIPAGTVVSTANPVLASVNAAGGSPKSFLRAKMMSSLDGLWGSGTTLFTSLNVSIMSGGTPISTGNQTLYCNLDKIDNTNVRLKIWLESFGPGSPYNYRTNQTVTITFIYSTFINPML